MGFLCCSVLQWVAVSGSEWQWVAVSGSEWQCVAVCCSVLQCVTGCYSTLQSVAVYGSVWQCMAVCCNHQAVFVHKSALGGQSVPQNTCTNSQLSKKNRQQLFQIRNKSGQYTTENRYKGDFWESLPAISVDAPPASYSKNSQNPTPRFNALYIITIQPTFEKSTCHICRYICTLHKFWNDLDLCSTYHWNPLWSRLLRISTCCVCRYVASTFQKFSKT